MFIEILNKIKEYDTIIIHRHIRPDGDCIGCQMGLKAVIKANFPSKAIYAVGDKIPEYLSKYGKNDEISDDIYQNALVIVVDTSNDIRICDDRWSKGKYIIKIDHHDDSPSFGDMEYVDPLSPACSSIMVRMIKAWNECDDIMVPKEAADAFYLGIVSDTGRFRYRGLTNEVLCNAGFLIDQGADTQDIYEHLYIDDAATLKLQGYVLNNFKLTPNGVAYIYFTKKMLKKYGVSKENAANLVNTLGSINGSLIWVAFIDQMQKKEINKDGYDLSKEIRCRLRSRSIAINGVASKYRGGGHLQASGATIYSKKEMKKMLEELDVILKKYKEDNPDAF